MIMIEDKKLDGGNACIKHGFFGRQGGVSAPPYDSLNCGLGSNDDMESVHQNRAVVTGQLFVNKENLVTLAQVHSAKCLPVTRQFEGDEKRPEADALVTDRAGLAIGVLTADCAPVLFTGRKEDGAPVIGAAHAGWGGALNGVTDATLVLMQEMGAMQDSIRAAIGPCIAQASYEVSIGFEKPFLKRDPEDERFFKAARKDEHLMFDLSGYVANRLAQAGVQQITIIGQDTCADEERFFSYRRATHRGEENYGRQISVIAITE